MIIPLLEDRTGFENAEEIFALLKPDVDAIGTGMGDLRFSLREAGKKADTQHPYIKEAAEKVAALSKKTGVPIMDMAFSPEGARETIARGTRILLYSLDQMLFYRLCQDIVRAVKG
jgi:2-keto-3-deoxy-L-rhamnonate aldolase RhmA